MTKLAFDDAAARWRERPKPVDQSCLADLIAVLEPHPRGLRRWSVMRAMRQRMEKAHREITPKFEDDVERVFRRFCEGDTVRAGMTDVSEEFFFRPKETAGEVWAVRMERARAWLESPAAF
ncbi:MAG TPA: hypothetical protein VIM56_15110 [Rhizomicrobium sp.]